MIKKIAALALTLLMVLVVIVPVFSLAGCAPNDPVGSSWGLFSTVVDGKKKETGWYYMKEGADNIYESIEDYWNDRLFKDDGYLRFDKNNACEMMLFGETKKGEYSVNRTLKGTTVKVKFDDKTKGEGYYRIDGYSGRTNGSVTVGDTVFGISNSVKRADFEKELENEKEEIQKAIDGIYEKEYNFDRSRYYCLGEFVEVDGKYIFEFNYNGEEYSGEPRWFPGGHPLYCYYFYQLNIDGSFSLSQYQANKLAVFRHSPDGLFSPPTSSDNSHLGVPSLPAIVYYLP